LMGGSDEPGPIYHSVPCGEMGPGSAPRHSASKTRVKRALMAWLGRDDRENL
jgi:hypothetical protein